MIFDVLHYGFYQFMRLLILFLRIFLNHLLAPVLTVASGIYFMEKKLNQIIKTCKTNIQARSISSEI